ncbi:MAG: CPBP family intramembrane metalloprotease [Cyanophyceae cyanobacterium]
MSDIPEAMNWKLALLVGAIAVPGPIAIALLALPSLVGAAPTPVPIATLQLVTAVQGIVLVAITAFLGTLLGHRVGLRAPVLAALVGGDRRDRRGGSLKPQLVPAAVGGLMGAGIILAFYGLSPAALRAMQGDPIPLLARVLYGGITEEVLIRWGLMSFLAWGFWRLLGRRSGRGLAIAIALAILLSALVFGLAHVPAVAIALNPVPPAIVAYITLGNAAFGLVAGVLFWRYGLEAAILAHMLAHLVAYAIRG